MKKLFLILALAIGQFVFAQNKSENETLKTFVERIIPEKIQKSSDKTTIIVDGKEIKNPEKYEFDILSMKEMKVKINESDKKNPEKISYTVTIITNKS